MDTKKLRYILVIALLTIMLAVPSNLALAEPSPDTVDVLVSFYQPPGSDEIELIESLGGSVKAVYHIVPTIAATMPSENLDELSTDPRVKLVEPDITLSACFAGETLPWGVDRVDAELVHPTNKGTGVKVAILDTGIDLDHPDLAVAGNVTFVPEWIDGDDDNGHGTLVAGIVAALDNDIGVIGVAPEASLYAVKVLNEYGSGAMSIILSGIEWAVDNNMQVINMSFGSASNWPSSVIQALDNAYNGGIIIVAGSGNGGTPSGEGNNIWNPARQESVIAVGATDNQDARYTVSSTGYTLELAAPGVNIHSTAMGGSYGYIAGTSASSSHAAGVAALLIASGLTNNVDVRHRLRNSAEDLGAAGWDSQFGKGMVNADLAINFSEPPDQTPPTTTISLNGTMGSLNWYSSDVEVTLTAADNDGGSGMAEIKFSLDSGVTWNTYSSPFTITTEGITPLLARAWDNAGNDEGPPALEMVNIDRIPPTSTMVLRGTMGNYDWYVSDVKVEILATDNPGGSGLAKKEYSLDGGETWDIYPISQVTISTEGTTQILARSWDYAGNIEEPPVSETFKIDQTPPTLTEITIPAEMKKLGKGVMVDVSYNGTAEDSGSGLYGTTNTVLIDEYGVFDQDLGSSLSGTVSVEAWCSGNDQDDRIYIFRLTASDYAGNEASVDAIVAVLHDSS
ncbi:S8 family peptidase [Chloroflexota bacterium]